MTMIFLNFEEPRIFQEFIRRSGGDRANLVILPQASSLAETGREYSQTFQKLGVRNKPVSLEFRDRAQADRKRHLELLRQATGIFIAGELGGLSLIRNAIAQGRMVVDEIARRVGKPTPSDLYDVVIIGAGPAGIAAALTAIQHGLNYLMLDEREIGGTILQYPRRKLVMTQPVELPLYGWLKQDEYSKECWSTLGAKSLNALI